MKADLSAFYAAATMRFLARRRLAERLDFCQPYVKFPEGSNVGSAAGGAVLSPRAVPVQRWSVPELCRAYQWPTGLAGGGVIGIVELGGGWVAADMEQYFRGIGQDMPTIVDVPINGAANAPSRAGGDPGADAEVTLDIQIAAAAYAVATGHPATIRVYWVGNDPSAIATGIRAAAADGCDTCSISWGADEAVWRNASAQLGQDLAAAVDAAATAAAAAGMVVFAAAGDNDSSDGGPDPANVDLPSSAPHIVGCGGTRKTTGSETVWNDDPGNPNGHGTGGGFSAIFPPQPWQANAPHGPGRMVPDVAGLADPQTGYEIVVHGQAAIVGGTSAVAPLYAGLFAALGRGLGLVTPRLWSNQLCFNDITEGDNGYFRARIGPDPCTGLGSPIGDRLAALFAAPAAADTPRADRGAGRAGAGGMERHRAPDLRRRPRHGRAAGAGGPAGGPGRRPDRRPGRRPGGRVRRPAGGAPPRTPPARVAPRTAPPMRILVIEDDAGTGDYIVRGLTQEGHAAELARTGKDGLFLALSEAFDVIVTDRMLPAPDGLAIVRAMRASAVTTPVLVLTALGDVERRVEGLDAGADDYLAKPFAFSELYARVRALGRRPPAAVVQAELTVGTLRMDLLRRTVTRAGVPIELLPTEWRLLEYMMRHPGQVLTRTMLLERVWDFAFDPTTNVVDVHVSRLRRKLEVPDGPVVIRTVRGAGYVLEA